MRATPSTSNLAGVPLFLLRPLAAESSWYTPARKLTHHLPYSLVIEKLSKHFGRVTGDDDTGPDEPFETIEALSAPIANQSPQDDP